MNGTATVTTITANVKDARATPVSPSQDAGVRERCAMLGIEWLDKVPQSDAAAAEPGERREQHVEGVAR